MQNNKAFNEKSINFLAKPKRNGRKRKFSKFEELQLTNTKHLKEVAQMSLRERVTQIKIQLKLNTLSPQTLLNLYHRHNIKFRKPNYFYQKKYKEQQDLLLKQ